MPNVVGMSYEAAKKRLEDGGFFMRATGAVTFYSNSTTASGQSVAGGETAAIGTVIEVQFSNVVEDGCGGLELAGGPLTGPTGPMRQNLERMKPTREG